MSGNPRLERDLPWILESLGAGSPPDYTDSVLGADRRHPAATRLGLS